MNLQRTLALAFTAIMVVSVVSSAFIGGAAATQEDGDGDNPLDGILESDNEEQNESGLDRIKDFVPAYLVDGMAVLDGQAKRFYSGIMDKSPLSDGPKTNEELAVEFGKAVEDRENVYLGFINDTTNVSSTYDTHQITFSHDASPEHVVYLAADVENQSVQRIEVLNQSAFNETGRDIDAEWVVVEKGAQDLPKLTHDLADRIENDRALDRNQQAQLVGQYCDVSLGSLGKSSASNCDIRSSLWLSNESLYEGVNDET